MPGLPPAQFPHCFPGGAGPKVLWQSSDLPNELRLGAGLWGNEPVNHIRVPGGQTVPMDPLGLGVERLSEEQ